MLQTKKKIVDVSLLYHEGKEKSFFNFGGEFLPFFLFFSKSGVSSKFIIDFPSYRT